MRTQSNLSWLFATGAIGVACNAVFGLEQLEENPPGGDSGEAGQGVGGASGSGKGGSSGATSKGGSSGSTAGGSAGTSGAAGESGGGMGGGDGDCAPGDEARCDAVDPTLVGNCGAGTVACRANGTWGPCSVTPAGADSCDDVGDDADCDGTANGGCPCLTGEERDCGPDTEDGICQRGTQTCENEVWGDCEGAVFPEMRDCMSTADNDCDGAADNVRDDICPCAVDGAHVCVEDAPADWEGPMARATAAATAQSPACTGTGFERQAFTKFGVIDSGTATCGCACGTPGHSCGSINMHRGTQSCVIMQSAVGPIEYPNMTAGVCFNVPGGGENFFPYSDYTGGSCNPNPTSNLVDAKFTQRMTACETTGTAAGCAAQSQCLPELVNPLDSFCVYHDGDVACPSGPYSERTVYYDTIDDPRTCSACTCATSTGSCTGSVTFVRQPCPGTIAVEGINYGSCGQVYDGGIAIAAAPSTPMPTGSCAPSSVSAQGSVTTTGARTVCCKP